MADFGAVTAPACDMAQHFLYRRDARLACGDFIRRTIDMGSGGVALCPRGLRKGGKGALNVGDVVLAVGVKAVQELPLAVVHVYCQHVAAASGVVDRRPGADACLSGQALSYGRAFSARASPGVLPSLPQRGPRHGFQCP